MKDKKTLFDSQEEKKDEHINPSKNPLEEAKKRNIMDWGILELGESVQNEKTQD